VPGRLNTAARVSTTAPADRASDVSGATVLPAENWPIATAAVAPMKRMNATA
jgi:hypothetical protein